MIAKIQNEPHFWHVKYTKKFDCTLSILALNEQTSNRKEKCCVKYATKQFQNNVRTLYYTQVSKEWHEQWFLFVKLFHFEKAVCMKECILIYTQYINPYPRLRTYNFLSKHNSNMGTLQKGSLEVKYTEIRFWVCHPIGRVCSLVENPSVLPPVAFYYHSLNNFYRKTHPAATQGNCDICNFQSFLHRMF